MLRTVYLVCRDAHQAQDITQDAFVELLRHWDKVSQYDRPGAWVRKVAIRKLIKAASRSSASPGRGRFRAATAAGACGHRPPACRRRAAPAPAHRSGPLLLRGPAHPRGGRAPGVLALHGRGPRPPGPGQARRKAGGGDHRWTLSLASAGRSSAAPTPCSPTSPTRCGRSAAAPGAVTAGRRAAGRRGRGCAWWLAGLTAKPVAPSADREPAPVTPPHDDAKVSLPGGGAPSVTAARPRSAQAAQRGRRVPTAGSTSPTPVSAWRSSRQSSTSCAPGAAAERARDSSG